MSNETPSIKIPNPLKNALLRVIALNNDLFNLECDKKYVFSVRFFITKTKDDLIATVSGIAIQEEEK